MGAGFSGLTCRQTDLSCHCRDLSAPGGLPLTIHQGWSGRASRDLVGTCLREVPRHCCVRPPRPGRTLRDRRGDTDSMQNQEIIVIGGVDAHADTHEAAALNERGALLATEQFPTTTAGYSALLAWLEGFGRIDTVAMESTASYAAGLRRYRRTPSFRGQAAQTLEVHGIESKTPIAPRQCERVGTAKEAAER